MNQQNNMAMEMVLNLREHVDLHKKDEHSTDYEQVCSKKSLSSDHEHGSKPSSPREVTGDFIMIKNTKQDKIESTRAEMGKMREENERLKNALEKITKDCRSLQMQLDMVQQEQSHNSTEISAGSLDDHDHSFEEQELVSLTLGTSLKKPKKEEAAPDQASIKADDELARKPITIDHDLTLGFEKTNEDQLKQKNQSPRKISECKNGKIEDTWPLNNVVKTLRNGEEELTVQEQSPLKKARVSVRARCEAPTMNDGCQWRKYGQKIAKGNPCPRAYYRCTVAPGCPVRKQVQRCAEDMSILVTTYEGNHNHPLPISATTMASTTSAAASMLISGSSTSGQTIMNPSLATTTAFSGIHNLNFSLSNSSRTSPFYLSNQSISPSSSCPTITIDLTSNPSASSQFNKYPANFFPSSSLNFNYKGNNHISYSKSQNGSFTLGAVQPQDQFYSPYLQKNPNNIPTQAALTSDTIAAATKVLTSDPNFKSALEAAITSMVGNGRRETNSGLDMKWGEQFQPRTSFTASNVINSCSPSFLNRSSSTTLNPQAGTFTFLPPALKLSSTTTDVSASPMNITEHTS